MKTVVAVIVVVALLFSVIWLLRHRPTAPAAPVEGPSAGRQGPGPTAGPPTPAGPAAGAPTTAAAGGEPGSIAFPADYPRPAPEQITFQGCPPVGDAGDPALNRLKNRVDVPVQPLAVPLDSILALPWPESIERRDRENWPAAARARVARYEGIPVVTTGYVVRARTMGPESPNCHGADLEHRDWHVWMTSTPDTSRTHSVVVETTPRVRAGHPEWRLADLNRAARAGREVRITGWLMLDPEHPDQVGRTRGTIWEIHPITAIEVRTRGRWAPLGQASTRRGR